MTKDDLVSKDTALKMAIEAIDYKGVRDSEPYWEMMNKTIKACKEALEQPSVAELNNEYLRDTHVEGLSQPAQEPVAWMHRHAGEITEFNDFQSCQYCEPLYTHPAPSWQGLSDNEIAVIIGNGAFYELGDLEFARAIEQALKEKNI